MTNSGNVLTFLEKACRRLMLKFHSGYCRYATVGGGIRNTASASFVLLAVFGVTCLSAWRHRPFVIVCFGNRTPAATVPRRLPVDSKTQPVQSASHLLYMRACFASHNLCVCLMWSTTRLAAATQRLAVDTTTQPVNSALHLLRWVVRAICLTQPLHVTLL